jgi:rod shape-determining protein MreD
MMRAGWVAVLSLATALVVQLSVLNGLRLPGGGVPDLVLVLVAALAMAEGPVTGMVTGFLTGLCLDLAPPGSAAVGQYALVFCLAGWAAGRLSPVASHSGRQSAGLFATALLALVVAVAEVLSAAVSLLVAPGTVALSQVRLVLPSTIGYDLVLVPFVLYLVMVGGTLLADRSAGARRFRTVMGAGASSAATGGAPTGTTRSRRAARRTRLRAGAGVPGSASGLARQPVRLAPPVHLRLAAGRRGDGMIGGGSGAGGSGWRRGQPGGHPGLLAGSARQFRPHPGEPGGSAVRSHSLTAASARVRPPAIRFGGRRGDGVLGHALSHAPTRPGLAAPGRPPAIRFGGRRGDGALGHALSHAPTRPGPAPAQRHAAIRFGGRRGDGVLGHALSHARTRPGPAPAGRHAAIRFGGRRGDGVLGHALSHAPTRPGPAAARRHAAIRFGGHRGDGSLGETFGHALTRPAPTRQPRQAAIRFGPTTGPRLKMGARRSAVTIDGTGAVPRLRLANRPARVSRRSAAVPRFRRGSAVLRPARLSSGVLPGGVLTEATMRARRARPTPRLRLSGGAPGMLGGTGRGPRLGRPPGRTGKHPRFSYGKHSPLSVLAGHRLGRRLGGSWLARRRVGSRSGVWLLGRRPGGSR